METTSPRKRMIAAGRIPPAREHRCIGGHVGPFAYDPGYTAWMRRHFSELGLPATHASFGCCLYCGKHAAIPDAEVA